MCPCQSSWRIVFEIAIVKGRHLQNSFLEHQKPSLFHVRSLQKKASADHFKADKKEGRMKFPHKRSMQPLIQKRALEILMVYARKFLQNIPSPQIIPSFPPETEKDILFPWKIFLWKCLSLHGLSAFFWLVRPSFGAPITKDVVKS